MVLTYFTVLEEIVQKSLEAIGTVGRKVDSIQRPLVVGGMAIQLHSQENPHLLRPTSDIDLINCRDYRDYKDFSSSIGDGIVTEVRDKGYQGIQKKSYHGYEIKIMNGQGNQAKELIFIHFDVSPPPYREAEVRETKQRIQTAKEILVRDVPVLVTRIEDIIPRKIKRLKTKLAKLEGTDEILQALCLEADLGNWNNLARIPLEEWGAGITRTQNSFSTAEQKHPSYRYVCAKDCYDLCLLSRQIETHPENFNRAYYLETKQRIGL